MSPLRIAALIAVPIGAVGSVALLLHAAQRPAPLLLFLISGWVLVPFAAIVVAMALSKRWSTATQATLYGATLILTLGTLAIYIDDASGHRTAQTAFVFVAVPPASVLVLALALSAAALTRGGSSRATRG